MRYCALPCYNTNARLNTGQERVVKMLNKSGLGGWMNRRFKVAVLAAFWCLSAGAAKSHAGFTDCNGNQIPDEFGERE